jgi:diguanylate cyclase (GGDEF)-like protein
MRWPPQLWAGSTWVRAALYVLVALIGVLGTTGLLVADLGAETRVTRAVGVALLVPWVVLWVALLLAERFGRRVAVRHARSQALLSSIAEARRLVLADEDPRQAVVHAVVSVTGARVCVLSEPEGTDLHDTAAAGAVLPDIRVPLSQPSLVGRVFATGEPARVLNIHDEADADQVAVASLESVAGSALHSITHVPVTAHGRVLGVLTAAFDRVDPELADAAEPILELLAAEVAVAIDRDRMLADLQSLAVTDELTAIANRRAWESAARTMSRQGAMVLLDLDHFKGVNDTRGHAAGDEVLRAFARVLADTVRSEDLCARIGGEEFAVLLHSGADPTALVDRIRTAWHADRRAVDQSGPTFSAGAAVREPDESLEDLQRRCDRALYAAKTQGRNRLVVASPTAYAPLDQRAAQEEPSASRP